MDDPAAAAPADRSPSRTWPALAGFVALAFSAAWIGSRFPPGAWYDGLVKPSWNPPSWLFGPVWTVLYLAMAVAAWMVWKRHGWRGPALPMWCVQLALNAAWSWLFFGLHRPAWAFAEIVVLWLAIAVTLNLFWRIRTTAGWLLVPYLAWVTFAALLNWTLWRLN
jgi:translocator protein